MTRPLRIGMDTSVALFSVRAGLYIHHRELVAALRRRRDIEVRLFANKWMVPPDQRDAVTNTVSDAFNLPLVFTAVPRRLRTLRMVASPLRRVDAFYHVPGGGFGPVPGIPNLYLVPDLIPLALDYPVEGFKDRTQQYLDEAIRNGDGLLVYSNHTRADLQERLGVDPGRVTVTPLAAGSDFSPDGPVGSPELAQALEGRPYVLHVGTLEPRKNLVTLIRAFSMMRRTHPHIPHRLVLCGAKWVGYEPIFAAIDEERLEREVIYIGRVDKVDALYRGASLLVFPSVYEGFGLPPLEAMACGIPVICSDATSLPEVVGEAGLMTSPYNSTALSAAMARVLTDRVLAQSLRQRGLERSREFTWNATARLFEEAVRQAIDGDK